MPAADDGEALGGVVAGGGEARDAGEGGRSRSRAVAVAGVELARPSVVGQLARAPVVVDEGSSPCAVAMAGGARPRAVVVAGGARRAPWRWPGWSPCAPVVAGGSPCALRHGGGGSSPRARAVAGKELPCAPAVAGGSPCARRWRLPGRSSPPVPPGTATAGGRARRGRHGLLRVAVSVVVNGDTHVREQGTSEARESQREGEQSSAHCLKKPAPPIPPGAPPVLLGPAVLATARELATLAMAAQPDGVPRGLQSGVQGGGGRTGTEAHRVATHASCPPSDRGERKNKISEEKKKRIKRKGKK